MYEYLLKNHFQEENKMAFLVGPRQVGKTTTSMSALSKNVYLNWDNQEHRKTILEGPSSVMRLVGGENLQSSKPYIIFDEIHKYPKWKIFLKGFFDTFKIKVSICVTGSARLDIYKHGGDSMMGRYFLYRMHPLSVREIISPGLKDTEISSPRKIKEPDFNNLLIFGGYPETFLRANKRFYNKWRKLRLEQLFNEDLRDLSRITDIGRIKVLAEKLALSAGSSLNYSHLSNDLQVSVDTIRRWLEALESIYYCFRLRPYSKNITRSLLKEPKIYLWDWSHLADKGKRNENFIASHLLKAVHYYNDIGMGNFQLCYLRDKSHREVDFLVIRDNIPWFLVEVKTGDQAISESLKYYKKLTKAPHAFQATFNMPFVNKNCFNEFEPVKVPVKTLLSQLV